MSTDLAEKLYYPIAAQSVGVGEAAKIVRGVPGHAVTMIRVDIAKGFREALHHHVQEQIMYVVSGRLQVILPGQPPVSVGPGEFFHFPSDAPHEALAEEDTVLLDVFAAPHRNEMLQPRPA